VNICFDPLLKVSSLLMNFTFS